MNSSKFLTACFLTFSFTIFSLAQTSSEQNQACNPEFARILVEQQVSESRTVEETDKRIKILIRSADFLWKFDEPTARKYFTEAFQVANERFKEKGFEQNTRNDKGRVFSTYLPDPRMEVIRAISVKDGDWAKRLTEQLLNEFDKNAADREDSLNQTRELSDLLSIAKENIKTNSVLSQYLHRRVMKYPLDSHWYFHLYEVAKENRQIADTLYGELLQNYQNETPRRLLFLSAYPFAHDRIFGIDKRMFHVSMSDSFSPNLNLQRLFIDTFFSRIAAFSINSDDLNRPAEKYRMAEQIYIFTALQEIEPIIVQNFPQLSQLLAEAKARAVSMMNKENYEKISEEEKSSKKYGFETTFDERLEIAEKADAEGKLDDRMILNLVMNAKTEEHFKKTESWLDKIKSEKTRPDLVNYFYYLWSKFAITENRFDDARKYATKVPELEHRAVLFLDIASQQLKDENQTVKVFETLNEVSKIARQSNNSVEKAQVLLAISTQYEKVNHTLALEELGEAIRVINQLENPDIFSTSIMRLISTSNSSHFISYSTPGFNMETTFKDLSKNDFEIILANAKNFKDKYFRTIAVLAIAKNCVEKISVKKPVKKIK